MLKSNFPEVYLSKTKENNYIRVYFPYILFRFLLLFFFGENVGHVILHGVSSEKTAERREIFCD
jgi:hypothetical protein